MCSTNPPRHADLHCHDECHMTDVLGSELV